MNKRILYLAFLAITLLLILSSSAVHAQAKWTFMVYLDADNDLEPFGILDFNPLQDAATCRTVHFVDEFRHGPGTPYGFVTVAAQ